MFTVVAIKCVTTTIVINIVNIIINQSFIFMIKKLLTITALGLVTTVTASALLTGNTDFAAVVQQAATTSRAPIATSEPIVTGSDAFDAAKFNSEAVQNALGSTVSTSMRLEDPQLPDIFAEPVVGKAEFGVIEAINTLPLATSRSVAEPEGPYIAKDFNTEGETSTASMSISPKIDDEGNPVANTYEIYNVYATGSVIDMTIDPTTGAVEIPCQLLLNHATYGEVKICPMSVTATGGFSYSDVQPVTGTIDENGVITLNRWGVIITQEGAYRGRGFNFFVSSTWQTANASVKAHNMNGDVDVEYPILVEQNGSNEAVFYCLSGFTTDILSARMLSNATLMMSPQKIYTNAYYGDFYMYPCDWNTTNPKPDANSNLVFSSDGNKLTTVGWAIAAKVLPSQYIGYGYSDIVITLDEPLNFPPKVSGGLSGAGTESDPYTIASLDDLKLLSQLVAEGDSFAGKYIAMTADIDGSSLGQSEYVPVGDAANPFAGNFDGRGHSVKNLLLDNKGFPYTGILGYTTESAVIRNLNAYNVRMTTVGDYIGIIAGLNNGRIEGCNVTACIVHSDGLVAGGVAGGSLGVIDNCHFTGSVTSIGSAAGIVGQAYGDIKSCTASGTFTIDGYVSSVARDAAGIAGLLMNGTMSDCWSTGVVQDTYGMGSTAGLISRSNNATVSRCFSTVAISAKRISSDPNNDTHTGGLTGYTSSSKFDDCFFAGTIVKSNSSENVGGLCGYLGVGYQSTSGGPTQMINQSIFTNCYSSGSIISSSSNPKKGIYGSTFEYSSWTGDAPEVYCFKNCSYDAQINSFGEDKYGRTTSFFTNGLPEGFDASVWTAVSGSYPVLTATKDVAPAVLSASPLLLQEGQTAKKVKKYFSWTPATGINWSVNDASLTVKGNRVTVGTEYTNAVVQNMTDDNTTIKLYQLAIVPDLFDGEGTESDPYQLKTVADFVTLNKAVSTYGQEHEGDYFVMPNDIDFAGTDLFKGVGYGMGAAVSFGGVLDGRGHSIHGLKIDAPVITDGKVDMTASVNYAALFNITTESAVIRNLVMAEDNDFRFFAYGAPFVGSNNGLIENCSNFAAVNSFNSQNGGIAALNNGTIRNCYNAGDITSCSTNAGGIAGYNNPTGIVELCQNDGNVIGASIEGVNANTAYNTFGGIVGYNYGYVYRSVNNGLVRAANTVGGIAGVANGYYETGVTSGNINNGQVEATTSCLTRGAIVGELRSGAAMSNNYYDNAVNVNGGANNNDNEGVKGMATADFIAATSLEGINADDVDFTPGLYPVLKAYKDTEATKALRAMYINFQTKQRRTNVLTPVSLSQAEGLKWAINGESTTFSVDGNTLNVTVPTDMSVGVGEVTATLGEKYTKTYALSSIPAILKGNGTADEPYLIETAKDWNTLADFIEGSGWEYPDNYFRIVNDLDFAGDSIRLVAVDGVNFQAVLDGNGKTIKNYVYNNINSVKTRLQGPNFYVGKNIGLIGTLGTFGVVKNLTADGTFSGYQMLGGIVGENYGRIENVTFKGTLYNTSSSGVAGIAYRTWEGSVITGCVNEGSVTAKTLGASGIVYEAKKTSLIENCANRGNVTTTTTGAVGIVYNAYGAVRGCVNEGKLSGTGTAAGIAYTGYPNSSFEDCHNRVDIDYVTDMAKPGGNIFGIVGNLNTRKSTDADLSGGFVKNCTNTGNLSGTDGVYGFGNNVKLGWTIEGVTNTGNITATTGLGCGLFNVVGEFSGGSPEWLTSVTDSYNTGNITANKAGVGGVASQLYNYSIMERVYNTGDIYNANTGLTTGGIVSKSNGKIFDSFNAGNVTSAGNAIGGLAGYISDGKADYYAEFNNCFNVGNVVSTYTGTNTNGNAGGLVGYFAGTNMNPDEALHITSCFNAGTVIANKRVGGISAGAFRPSPKVTDTYNSGRIICLEPDDQGRYYWSGTTFTNNYTYVSAGDTTFMLANHANCYYDVTVNPGSQFRNVPGSAKTTSELRNLEISDAFTTPVHGGYPVLKAFADDHAAQQVSAALLVLFDDEKQNHEKIGDHITLVGPANATWTVAQLVDEVTEGPQLASSLVSTSAVTIEDDTALVRSKADNVVLTCTTPEGYSKSFIINVDPSWSGAESLETADKEVESVFYIDIQGRCVTTPVAGQVYIVRTNYTDGTHSVAKMIARD